MRTFIFLILWIFFTNNIVCGQYQTPFKVVIDPGHGGKDPGTKGSILLEKNIVLDIGIRVKANLDLYSDAIQTELTRSKDEFISLHERSAIANHQHADLFLSLHCNHFHNHQVQGSEIYVLGLHKSKENLEVAKRENAAILYEKDYDQNYGGFDPNSDEGHIMMSLFQSNHLLESIDFSAQILDDLDQHTSLEKRAVKQAGFVVLHQSTMPSALLELAFLSNKEDEDYLNSVEGREEIAQAISKSILAYFGIKKVTHDVYEVELMVKEGSPLTTFDQKWEKISSFSIEQRANQYHYLTIVNSTGKDIDQLLDRFKEIGFTAAKLVKKVN